MVGLWFKRAFQFITRRGVEDYAWSGEWTKVAGEAYDETVDDILIRQEIQKGRVEVSGTIDEPTKRYFTQHKAYIVWYSGPDYKIRREVGILFWVSPDDKLSETEIKNWLEKACRSALGADLSTISHWAGYYVVLDATTGVVREDVSDFTLRLVSWEYSKETGVTRRGVFSK